MSAGGGRIWLLYAAGWTIDAVRPSWSISDCPMIDGRTHTMSVSAAVKQPAVSNAPQGPYGTKQRCHCSVGGVTVSSMVSVGGRLRLRVAELVYCRKAPGSQPSHQSKPASSLAHVRARVGERCAKTAFFFNHMSRECAYD